MKSQAITSPHANVPILFQSKEIAVSTLNQEMELTETEPLIIGPVYFRGRAPFNTKVKVITCLTSGAATATTSGKQYITYVGFKKETDNEYDFDEMIPNETWEGAQRTHEKACGFFDHSTLFIKD